ncbi:hypothetical protein RN001_009767 [Aquatica leii]|uniref:FHA domain-containing protein n=1 Tax=Aquatica leii TaxID=1421715 RepID=A0AAN7S8A4_9COLE|nr:hypothetical protein RN001_009767 [Aquatica leii]
MLYYLTAKDGSLFYLLPDRSYSVGRKEGDLVVKDDAVSRKHAMITVKNNEVSVMDCGSTYGTFINDTKLKGNQSVQVQEGNIIKFGVLASVYKLNQVSIITTTSGIGSDQKHKLKNTITAIGGLLVQNWTNQCTHVSVNEITLTVKVLSAVITGVPIVTLKYWDYFINCVNNKKPIPSPLNYIPKCSEPILKENLNFEYKEERRQLFKDKIFMFPLKSDTAKMASLIKAAGGEFRSWEESPYLEDTIEERILKKYVIIETGDKVDKSLLKFVSKYTETGQRTIPLQEIALAIINCSCEQDCNPKFNRKAVVFKRSDPEFQQKMDDKVLAMSTQSLDVNGMSEGARTELVIPETCDITTKIEVVDEPLIKLEDKFDDYLKPMDVINVPCSLKRDSELDHNDNSAKKVKVEETVCLSRSIIKKSTTPDIAKHVEPRSASPSVKSLGGSLFAFKHEKITDTGRSPTTCINPFSKKRKAQEDILNQTKKPNFLNNSATLPTKTMNNLVVNPFANLSKSRKRNTPDDVKVTSTPIESHENTATNFPLIPIVDSRLETSVPLIKKTNHFNISSIDKNHEQETTDNELLKFIRLFKDSAVLEIEDSIIRNTDERSVRNQSLNESSLKNFKKFKKIQPRRIQSTIVPESSYASVVCN